MAVWGSGKCMHCFNHGTKLSFEGTCHFLMSACLRIEWTLLRDGNGWSWWKAAQQLRLGSQTNFSEIGLNSDVRNHLTDVMLYSVKVVVKMFVFPKLVSLVLDWEGKLKPRQVILLCLHPARDIFLHFLGVATESESKYPYREANAHLRKLSLQHLSLLVHFPLQLAPMTTQKCRISFYVLRTMVNLQNLNKKVLILICSVKSNALLSLTASIRVGLHL